jgi:hypothetical protein
MIQRGGGINGSHFVPLEGKFLLIALVMPVQKPVVKLSNTSTTFSQKVEITLSKCLRV